MRSIPLYTFVFASTLAAAGCATSQPGAGADQPAARARLIDSQGNQLGTIDIAQLSNGVALQIEVQGLTPGAHGIHIHEVGECVGDFSSAGGHLDPYGRQHGLVNPEGPHLGDLPNLVVDEQGRARAVYPAYGVTLEPTGVESLVAGDGTALIIHSGPDDQVSDPAGNSGTRVLCGVIERI